MQEEMIQIFSNRIMDILETTSSAASLFIYAFALVKNTSVFLVVLTI